MNWREAMEAAAASEPRPARAAPARPAAFVVQIELENDAFVGPSNGGSAAQDETARLLRWVAERVLQGESSGSLRDINGNGCGYFRRVQS